MCAGTSPASQGNNCGGSILLLVPKRWQQLTQTEQTSKRLSSGLIGGLRKWGYPNASRSLDMEHTTKMVPHCRKPSLDTWIPWTGAFCKPEAHESPTFMAVLCAVHHASLSHRQRNAFKQNLRPWVHFLAGKAKLLQIYSNSLTVA